MDVTLEKGNYVSWFSYLAPSSGYAPSLLVSASVTIGIFILGGFMAWVGNITYLRHPSPYIGAFSIFWMLAWLGWMDGVYADVWNDVRGAFAVDKETYRALVHRRLNRIYDERRILAYALILGTPYIILVAVMFLPRLPFHESISNFITRPGYFPQLHGNRILRVCIIYLYGAVAVLAFTTAINAFVNHIALVREVSDLPFQDIYTSASELEPVAKFTLASATAWFAGISVIVLLVRAGLDVAVGLAIIIALVFVGIAFFLAPQLILHAALLEAKRELLADTRKEYEEMQRLLHQDLDDSESLSLRLEVTDRRLENAKSIRTWPYDITSVGKLVAASIIPWLTLIERVLQLINDIGGG